MIRYAPQNAPSVLRDERPQAQAAVWYRSWWVAVVLSAFAVRIFWAVRVPISPVSDCSAYDTFARNLADGLVYGFDGVNPSAYWPVGTGFMYSLVYRIFDPAQWGYGPVAALNVLIGVAIVVLAMQLGRRWFGPLAGLLTGAMLALWPMHVQFATVIASEQIFTLLCLAGILAWAEPGQRRGLMRAALAGVVFAAAVYVRPTAALLPIVLAGSTWLRGCRFRDAIAHVVVATLVIAVLIAPWSVRNTRAFGEFVLISTNGGANLWMGNNPDSDGHYMDLPPLEGMNEAQVDAELGRRAKQYIFNEPGAFAVRTAIKAVRLHERETIGIAWNEVSLSQMMSPRGIMAMKVAGQVYWLAALAMACAGAMVLVFRWRIKAVAHPALAVWGYFTAVHAVIVIQDRYHFPATPIIAALAALAFVAAWQRGRWGHPDKVERAKPQEQPA